MEECLDVRRVACLGLLLLVSAGCAMNRSQVKSLRDADAARVEFDPPVLQTVSVLDSLPSSCGPHSNRRVRPEEFHVYELTGRITRIKREPDHDVHIVLADLLHPASHLVVEAGDPDFRKNALSPYRERVAAGRGMVEALIRDAGGDPGRLVGAIVRVRGVGFFDFNHLQVGRSRSCIELHPVTFIERVP